MRNDYKVTAKIIRQAELVSASNMFINLDAENMFRV